jgi:hypothetical protein
MSRDPIELILSRVERPVAPSAEFRDDLLAQLLEELGEAPEPGRTFDPSRHRRPWLRRPLLAMAAVIAVVVVLAPLMLVFRGPTLPTVDQALRRAQRHFAMGQPFTATVAFDY